MKKIEKIAKGLLVISLAGLLIAGAMPEPTSGAVTVSATVVAGAITCSTPLTAANFGTVDDSQVYTADENSTTTVSTNGTIYVKAIGVGNGSNPGMATDSPAYLIPSPNAAFDASTTLSLGVEGYGIQATTTSGDITIAAKYFLTGNDVGGVASTSAEVVATTGTVTDQIVEIIYKAAVANDTQAGVYEDQVTISCVGS